MRVFITGYSAAHIKPSRTGTFASMLARAFVECGHRVVQDRPRAHLDAEYDLALIGIASPLGASSRYSASALSLIGDLGPDQILFLDDPNIRVIGTSHRRIIRTPDDMKSSYLQNAQSPQDKVAIEKHMPAVLRGAALVAEPNSHNIVCLTPRHSWATQNSIQPDLAAGIASTIAIDPSSLILNQDAALELGIAAEELGALARQRADIFIAQRATTSRAKALWIYGVEATTSFPIITAADARASLVDAFAQVLVSSGTLEQPPSSTVSGWWSPWLALSLAGGAYYATDSETAKPLPAPFAVLPSKFETLTDPQRRAVVNDQRDAIRFLIRNSTPDTIVKQIIGRPTK